jgi:hypothetical protein
MSRIRLVADHCTTTFHHPHRALSGMKWRRSCRWLTLKKLLARTPRFLSKVFDDNDLRRDINIYRLSHWHNIRQHRRASVTTSFGRLCYSKTLGNSSLFCTDQGHDQKQKPLTNAEISTQYEIHLLYGAMRVALQVCVNDADYFCRPFGIDSSTLVLITASLP